MGRRVVRWTTSTGKPVVEYFMTQPAPLIRPTEYRFNRCKRYGLVLKSTIRKTGKHWYWSCFMCLNLQRYPR